jgi:hypothetical protein
MALVLDRERLGAVMACPFVPDDEFHQATGQIGQLRVAPRLSSWAISSETSRGQPSDLSVSMAARFGLME